MGQRLVNRLMDLIDPFLDRWTEGMDRAGYLRYTTAKREDCVRSLEYFLEPMLESIRSTGSVPPFWRLLEADESWNRDLIETARRHRFRGVTAEMFVGCFKTLVHAVEELILEMDVEPEEKLAALGLIRHRADAFETALVGDWTAMTQREAHLKLDESNRRLTLEKNKYENILNATSDMVLVTDAKGTIVEANAAAIEYLGPENLIDIPFWYALGLEGSRIDEVVRYYRADELHEISPAGDGFYFSFKIVPLSLVSLASSGYMLILHNVSCAVAQRQTLEQTLQKRTVALARSEKQFTSLFQAAGESILLANVDFKVVQANDRTSQVFGLEPRELVGLDCVRLCHPLSPITIDQAICDLDENEIWTGEMIGCRSGGEAFPIFVTINRVVTDEMTLFHVLVWDVTDQKALEDRLRREKEQLEELNVTLRHVMKTIDSERQELLDTVDHKVQELLIPALDKLEKEPSGPVRTAYVEIIRDQLQALASGASIRKDARLLKLTPTEMKICQYIQGGSTSKDIAEAMNLAVDTVQTHRKNIRKKLGIRGRDVNLYTFLMVPEPESDSIQPSAG
jgi:PAS domain S-box-containing protein